MYSFAVKESRCAPNRTWLISCCWIRPIDADPVHRFEAVRIQVTSAADGVKCKFAPHKFAVKTMIEGNWAQMAEDWMGTMRMNVQMIMMREGDWTVMIMMIMVITSLDQNISMTRRI